MLKSLWIDHQRFLLASGVVALLFLVGNSWVSGISEATDRRLGVCRELERQIVQIHKDLERTYHLEARRKATYEKEEALLALDLSLAEEPERKDSASLLIDLNRRIDEIWTRAQTAANAIGLALPDKLGPKDFDIDVDSRDGPEEYRYFHAYLTVVERALEVLIDSEVDRIGTPEVIPPLRSDVLVGESSVGICDQLGVAMPVTAPYESFARVFQAAQDPSPFLQVRIHGRLVPVKGQENLLKGELEFYGSRIAPVVAEVFSDGTERSSSGRSPGPRRSKR
jgi:hypothetical protein